MTDALIAVTGATGGVGGRVARRLADAGVRQRLLVRDPDRAPRLPGAQIARASYDEPATVRDGVRGADTLFLVSAHEHPDRVGLHAGAVDAALACGVRRIVYVSFFGAAADATFTFARDHFHTEQHIRAAGVPFTFLRDNLYQDVLPYFAGRDGVIRGPAGDGRFAPVARDDIAAVAVAVLTGDGHDGRRYDLTGPERITMADVAERLTRATGRQVRYHAETLDEAYQSRSRYGAPQWEVAGWVTSYAAIAEGELEGVSDAVAAVTGRPPMSFSGFLVANPHSLKHLRA
jgi:uncharacterized protein YbjT (DUF2867 family)